MRDLLKFTKKGVTHYPLKWWEMENGVIIAIYQGERGANPALDFIVKYKEPGKRLRAPSHTHWIVDAVYKGTWFTSSLASYFTEWLEIYDVTQPFATTEERDNYCPMYREYMSTNYEQLNGVGPYTIEFLSTLIELFIKCEKQTPNAFMFKTLLELARDYANGKKDFYQIIGYSKRV